jgi:thiamine biosynthesis protein ThiS
MTVTLNGERSDAGQARNIAELVQTLGLPADAILVEHNGLALHRREWTARPVTDGDRIEFIRVVAGG